MPERIKASDLYKVAAVGVISFSALVASAHKPSECIDPIQKMGNEHTMMVCTNEHELVLVRNKDFARTLPRGVKEEDVVVGTEDRVVWGNIDKDRWLDVFVLHMDTGVIERAFHDKLPSKIEVYGPES